MQKDSKETPKKRGPALLIVEDNTTMREFLVDYLSIGRYQIASAEDGREAIQILRKKKFDVAIVDLRLPGKSGIEVLEKAREYQPSLKSIIITAYPSVDSVTRATELGAVDYLTKPFSLDELDAMMEDVLGEMPSKRVRKPKIQHEEDEAVVSSIAKSAEIYKPSEDFIREGEINSLRNYKALYNWSVRDPKAFWEELAGQLEWDKKWDNFLEYDFRDNPEVKYFSGGGINVCQNCLDRHLKTWRKNKAALIWQGEKECESKTFTYQELHHEVCKFANVLKKHGIRKGNSVTIYMPMIPELVISMLACARIGALHNVVYSGFNGDALEMRLSDAKSKILVTADGYMQGGKTIRTKDKADAVLEKYGGVKSVITVKRLGTPVTTHEDRDYWWHDEMDSPDITPFCEPEMLDASDPLFILYTSGSSGKPKGIVHGQGGYLLYSYQTTKWIFDLKDSDVYWCTADIGWITGHSYTVYGPLSCGATNVIYEGAPTYPNPDKFWQIIERYGVSILYTTPTMIRTLMKEGDQWPSAHDLSTLRLLGSVGEPINPEAWMWYHRAIGNERCPIVDTWWQTETGGILITPLPAAIPTKPGSATLPFPGIEPIILNKHGQEVEEGEGGYLCIKKPWPGIMQTIYKDPEQFKELYFSKFPGYYFTGDSARRDEDGYYWLMGRIDDVINISGNRLGSAELENALTSHKSISEATVVGAPHEVEGQCIYAFIVPKKGVKAGSELAKEIRKYIRGKIGAMAVPESIRFVDEIPKTRSGKTLRRVLIRIATGATDNLGNLDTLANPDALNKIIKESGQETPY